jgi:drug/metabolite transporter (DMT)-like permease
MTNQKTKANVSLVFITLIYGMSFVVLKIALKTGLDSNFLVFSRGVLFLLCTLIFFGKSVIHITKKEFMIGSVAGLLNFGGYFFQTAGMENTSPGNSAFITCLNALFVPFIAYFVYKIKPSKKIYVALPLGLTGTAILTGIIPGFSLSLNTGDLYTLVCAVLFAFLIAYLGYTADKIDFKKTAFLMALWQSLGGLTLVLCDGGFDLSVNNPIVAIISVVFLGIICSFFATSVQIYAQKNTSASTTALILTLEGVFAGFISVLFNIEPFTYALLSGGFLIISALIILEAKFVKIK